MSLHFDLWPVEVRERYIATVRRLAGDSSSLSEEQLSVLRAMALESDLAGRPEDEVTTFLDGVISSAGVRVAPGAPRRAGPGSAATLRGAPDDASGWGTWATSEDGFDDGTRLAAWGDHGEPLVSTGLALATVARDAQHRLVVWSDQQSGPFARRWHDGVWDEDSRRLGDLDSAIDAAGASACPEHEEVFAVTRDGALVSTWWVDGTWHDWASWQLPDGFVARAVAAASMWDGHEEVFALGEHGALVHRWRTDHGEWTPAEWSDFGTRTGAERIAAAGTHQGTVVAVVGPERVEVRRFSAERMRWEDWHNLGQAPGGGPARDVTVTRADREDAVALVVLGADGRLHQRRISLTA